MVVEGGWEEVDQTVRVYFNFSFSCKDLHFLQENPLVGTTLGLEQLLQSV